MKRLAIFGTLLLCTSSLFAAADLQLTPFAETKTFRAGFTASGPFFTVLNFGPEVARNVKISISASVPVACSCDVGDLPPATAVARFISFDAPATAGPLTITATVTSSTADDNQSNNTTSMTLTISADPDLSLQLLAPLRQDLGVPFTLDVHLGNHSRSTAHDIDIAVDFPAGVAIRSLPAGCVSPAAGRILCHTAELAGGVSAVAPLFSIALVAPEQYGTGSIVFHGKATAREPEFYPSDNEVTQITTLYKTFYVTTTANDGGGSLRQAILDANAGCGNSACAIAFRIQEQSAAAWKTIRVTSPLPAVTAAVRIDGATQRALAGGGNAVGPDVEISGGNAAGDGLLLRSCGADVAGLAINGFPGNGISIIDLPASEVCFTATVLHDLFIGTDPTGSAARPNFRGIGTAFGNGVSFADVLPPAVIRDSVISGNTHSGIFALSGRISVTGSRIGVKAHGDEPLPNGNAGVYVGLRGYGSLIARNTIAFNGHMGVGIAAGVADVDVSNNRIWSNGGLGIDYGLDGPTASEGGAVTMPVLTLAHYDPATKQTIIEGDLPGPLETTFAPFVDFFGNDSVDPSGFGEGQRPLGGVRALGPLPAHFRFAFDGDLTGQFITATATRLRFIGFAKTGAIEQWSAGVLAGWTGAVSAPRAAAGRAKMGPNGIEQGNLTQTSELSRAIEVR